MFPLGPLLTALVACVSLLMFNEDTRDLVLSFGQSIPIFHNILAIGAAPSTPVPTVYSTVTWTPTPTLNYATTSFSNGAALIVPITPTPSPVTIPPIPVATEASFNVDPFILAILNAGNWVASFFPSLLPEHIQDDILSHLTTLWHLTDGLRGTISCVPHSFCAMIPSDVMDLLTALFLLFVTGVLLIAAWTSAEAERARRRERQRFSEEYGIRAAPIGRLAVALPMMINLLQEIKEISQAYYTTSIAPLFRRPVSLAVTHLQYLTTSIVSFCRTLSRDILFGIIPSCICIMVGASLVLAGTALYLVALSIVSVMVLVIVIAYVLGLALRPIFARVPELINNLKGSSATKRERGVQTMASHAGTQAEMNMKKTVVQQTAKPLRSAMRSPSSRSDAETVARSVASGKTLIDTHEYRYLRDVQRAFNEIMARLQRFRGASWLEKLENAIRIRSPLRINSARIPAPSASQKDFEAALKAQEEGQAKRFEAQAEEMRQTTSHLQETQRKMEEAIAYIAHLEQAALELQNGQVQNESEIRRELHAEVARLNHEVQRERQLKADAERVAIAKHAELEVERGAHEATKQEARGEFLRMAMQMDPPQGSFAEPPQATIPTAAVAVHDYMAMGSNMYMNQPETDDNAGMMDVQMDEYKVLAMAAPIYMPPLPQQHPQQIRIPGLAPTPSSAPSLWQPKRQPQEQQQQQQPQAQPQQTRERARAPSPEPEPAPAPAAKPAAKPCQPTRPAR